ncbi:methylmalonyl-CoA epimerase [Agrobacterium rhizogenes]|uniref:methylmalonyl-CoA epimerase n=1 Tax=Rhizobium rhizogenes NBRC 13257 TaxID=1220581 RepID=A0AA87Q7D8_RHIRH|nr:methylmalonyl-CoA epimerase [Rhizobium rhizogenes]NTG65100.1 methylmalonyl-CoA epimerase [Rhizobium rhizogenes]NTG71551.1 methylmalonyl-CoA epimerase [Rhizobium rhizogenes]NTG84450.1 methylmalonyl-CoA epimerase [Rhizobium rhizogenes]NTG90844.1 methylmalonyl-CoA epimerase [Rhizobium rhizogenes]NTH29478.1 methylmalonyl-CoA epimerase [Rhizobium rhizogenes]
MLGPLNHVAIAVPNLKAAVSVYEKLGADISPPQDLPEHGVTVVFIQLPNTKLELLYPLGENSPIAPFLAKNPAGGIHHLSFDVPDILEARKTMTAGGIRILGSGEPSIGAHGTPVLFAHPKDLFGTLIEIEQAD